MTAITATEAAAPAVAPAGRRIWNVVRMHVANPWNTLIVPWIITLAIFGINLAIWLMVINAAGGRDNLEADAFTYNGGATWIVVFMTVVAAQCMSLSFRFALGFSVTRRDFYLGSSLYFVLLSLLYSTGFTAIAALEKAVDGWGIGAAFFAPWGLQDQPMLTVWFLYLTAMLLFFFLGAAVATVWVRWRAYGLYAFFITLAVILVAAGWAITASQSWGEVGSFFASTPLEALAAWTLPVSALCAAVGYALLMRSTPRS